MLFDENDIKFDVLSCTDFEELCFDLLCRLGFYSLVWRQGGADQGRDIEGKYNITNTLIENYEEKWFIECKNYKGGVPVEEVSEKISWAEAERPQHLVIIVSSYLTNNTREWLRKRTKSSAFHLHIIEGKRLKQIILGFNQIIEKYFIDRYLKLLSDAIKNWMFHGLLPDTEMMYQFSKNIKFSSLSLGELGFIWSAWLLREPECEKWKWNRHGDDEISFSPIIDILKKQGNKKTPIFKKYKNFKKHRRILIQKGSDGFLVIQFIFDNGNMITEAIYSYYAFGSGEGIEMAIEGGSEVSGHVRFIKSGSKEEKKRIEQFLN